MYATSLGTDYRGINVVVWNYLQNIYGGGPEFVRGKTSVNELEMSSSLLLCLCIHPFNANVNLLNFLV